MTPATRVKFGHRQALVFQMQEGAKIDGEQGAPSIVRFHMKACVGVFNYNNSSCPA